jgi:uncharacterized membrane protein YfcA
MLILLLAGLALAALAYGVMLVRAARAAHAFLPRPEAVAIGAVTNFLDTLGIGCFAPTMAWFKVRRLVPDRLIPSTMLAGHTLPSMTQAVVFLVLLGVFLDPVLLTGCVLALLAGGVVGAPLVARAQVWVVQGVVGVGLAIAAAAYAMTNLDLLPGGGVAASLPPALTVLAVAASFVFGVLLDFGIGHYAPTLVLLSLMGMDPHLVFPIMATGGGLACAGASVRNLGPRTLAVSRIDLRIALGIALGGIPAVLAAAFLVKAMPLAMLRWLVTAVVLYTSVVMLRAAVHSRQAGAGLTEPV